MSANIIKQADTSLFLASASDNITALDSNYTLKIVATQNLDSAIVSRFTFKLYNYGKGLDSFYFDSTYYSYGSYETIKPAYTQTAFTRCNLKITNTTSNGISGTFRGKLADGSEVVNGVFTARYRRYQWQ